MLERWVQNDEYLALKRLEFESKLKQLNNNEDKLFCFCAKVIQAIRGELYGDVFLITESTLKNFRNALNKMSYELSNQILQGVGDIQKMQDVKKCLDEVHLQLVIAENDFKSIRKRTKAIQQGRNSLDNALSHLAFHLQRFGEIK